MLIDKRLREFIESSERLKQKYGDKVEFYVCGKPEKKESLGFNEEQINVWVDSGLIKYLGHIDSVVEQMIKSDCIVLPSYREGTPRVLLEAAAVGRPILTTDAPGCREVVQNNINGLLCEVKDANGLYIIMEKMFLTNPEKKTRNGYKGKTNSRK